MLAELPGFEYRGESAFRHWLLKRALHKIVDRTGVRVTLADSTDPEHFARKLTERTRLVWIESPGNPRMSITDIARCAAMAHDHGALLGIDNTFATPALTRPLELGADIVMHSATKFIGGHGTSIGGIVVDSGNSKWTSTQ